MVKLNGFALRSTCLWGLALGACLGFARGEALAEPPHGAAQQHSQPAPDPAATSNTVRLAALAEALLGLDALEQGRGRGNHGSPAYVLIGGKQAGKHAQYLCRVGADVEAPCIPPEPGLGSDAMSPCTQCDPSERNRSWQRYARTELGLLALELLLQLRLDQSHPEPLAQQLTAWLESLEPSAPQSKVLLSGLTDLRAASQPRARRAALHKHLQAVLDALGLSMTPVDLSEEGGLRATLKLAGHARDTARTEWRQRFTQWSQCQLEALAAGKVALADATEVDRCNRRNATVRALEASVLAGRRRRLEHTSCLESTLRSKLAVAQYQNTPCADGTLLASGP
jgi:hypothetical protein